MNDFDKRMRRAAEEEKSEIPSHAKKKLEETLKRLPERNTRRPKPIILRVAAFAACFLVLTVLVLPNVSAAYAEALSDIPVLGDIIRVFTVRSYNFSDGNYEMDIKVPEIETSETGDAAERINKDVNELTNELISNFYKEAELVNGEGHGSIYIDYEVIREDETWFTLKLNVSTVAASSSGYFKYYHIDRRTGEYVMLSDLFTSQDFTQLIAAEIKRQMKEEMDENSQNKYYVDETEFGYDFTRLDGAHNFYISDDGKLVIPFDKYEVAPGYMGCPEFTVDAEVFADILKEDYKDLFIFQSKDTNSK